MLESAFWLLLGVAFLLAATRFSDGRRRRSGLAGVAFLMFAISDLIELRTGAWWRPWPLLVLKGLCVAVLIWVYVQHFRERRACSDAEVVPIIRR